MRQELTAKNVTIHYCKSLKSSGKPIIITDLETKEERHVSKWSRRFFDDSGDAWKVGMRFNNSKGKAKSSGATTVLYVQKEEDV